MLKQKEKMDVSREPKMPYRVIVLLSAASVLPGPVRDGGAVSPSPGDPPAPGKKGVPSPWGFLAFGLSPRY